MTLLMNEPWAERGACVDPKLNPEIFFPARDEEATTAAAKSVCRTCPVMLECRTWAVDTGQFGVWGETTEEERASIPRSDGTGGRFPCDHKRTPENTFINGNGHAVCRNCRNHSNAATQRRRYAQTKETTA